MSKAKTVQLPQRAELSRLNKQARHTASVITTLQKVLGQAIDKAELVLEGINDQIEVINSANVEDDGDAKPSRSRTTTAKKTPVKKPTRKPAAKKTTRTRGAKSEGGTTRTRKVSGKRPAKKTVAKKPTRSRKASKRAEVDDFDDFDDLDD